MKTRALLVGLLCLAACGPKAAPTPKTPPPPPPGQIGESCTPGDGLVQATCASGLLCMPGAGFCTSMCPCGEGSVCAPSVNAPEMCMKACSSDADCSGSMVCHPDHKACAPDGHLAAKAPTCSEPALARDSFGKVTQVSKAGKATYDPTAVLDKTGDLVAIYLNGIHVGPNGLAAAKLDLGKEVSLAEADHALSLERENLADPWLARDRGGKLFLSYLGFNGGGAPEKNMVVGVTTSDDGLTWSKPVTAHDAATDCPGEAPGCLDKPIVAIGPNRLNDKVDVVYVLYWSAATNSLRATHSNDGGQTFSPSAKVGDGPYADAEVTSSGKMHVVYVGGNGHRMGDAGNGTFYTSTSDGGETFAEPVRISAEGESVPLHFASPRVIVDVPRRLLYAVYTTGTSDGKWDVVLATSRDGGLAWTRQKVNDDNSCATHMMPAAALDPATGKIHLVWLENRSGAGAVGYSACAAGGEKCSKNEQVNETPFAAFGFAKHSTSTVGDYISVLVDSKKKTVHALWTQPVDEGGAIAARIFHSSARAR